MNKIEIKPLVFENKPTLLNQLHKIEEESKEFNIAFIRGDVDNALEEFYDNITVRLNALRLMDIPLEVIIDNQIAHFQKLKDRGWEFEDE